MNKCIKCEKQAVKEELCEEHYLKICGKSVFEDALYRKDPVKDMISTGITTSINRGF